MDATGAAVALLPCSNLFAATSAAGIQQGKKAALGKQQPARGSRREEEGTPVNVSAGKSLDIYLALLTECIQRPVLAAQINQYRSFNLPTCGGQT